MTTATRLHPRRNLKGIFAPAVREDGWHDSDLAGQQSAQQLVDLGATGVYVNTFGVAYGHINGVEVLISRSAPTLLGYDGVVLVTRRTWTPQHGGFLRVSA
jgi:hypothetical protein